MKIDVERISHDSSFASLLSCDCGHDFGRHSTSGCDRRAFCRCHRSPSHIVRTEIAAASFTPRARKPEDKT